MMQRCSVDDDVATLLTQRCDVVSMIDVGQRGVEG